VGIGFGVRKPFDVTKYILVLQVPDFRGMGVGGPPDKQKEREGNTNEDSVINTNRQGRDERQYLNPPISRLYLEKVLGLFNIN
jgi:hypothetical protein